MAIRGNPNEYTCVGCKYFYREENAQTPMCGHEIYGDESARNLTYIHPDRPDWCEKKYGVRGKHGKMFETTQQRARLHDDIEQEIKTKRLSRQWKEARIDWYQKQFAEEIKARRRGSPAWKRKMERIRQLNVKEELRKRKESQLEIPSEIRGLLNKIYLTKRECYDKILELGGRELADYCYEMIKVEKYMDIDMTEYHPIMLDGKMYFGKVDLDRVNMRTLSGHVKVKLFKVEFYNEQPADELWLPKENILPKINKNLYVEYGGVKIFTVGRFEYDKKFKQNLGGKPPECTSCGEKFKEANSRMVVCTHCHSVLCLDCLISLQDGKDLYRHECGICGHEMWTRII